MKIVLLFTSVLTGFLSFSQIIGNIEIKNPQISDLKKPTDDLYIKLNGGIVKESEMEDGTKVKTTYYLSASKYRTAELIKPSKSTGVKQGPVQTQESDGWKCQESTIRVSAEDDQFMNMYNERENAHIYPGAIYRFNDFYSGKFAAYENDRHPFRIATTASRVDGDIFEWVQSPSSLDVLNARNKITMRTVQDNINRGFKAKIYECTSAAEMALRVGVTAGGYGAKLDFMMGNQRSTQDRFFLIDATQEVYSMFAEVPSDGLFKSKDELPKDLMMMRSVTYGMRVLVTIKTTLNTVEDVQRFGASYKGFGFEGGVSLDNLQKSFNSSTEVRIYVVGGENTGFLECSPSELMAKLNESFKTLNYYNAAPLYFTFVDMNDVMLRTTSATDESTSRQCVPVPPKDKDPNLRYYQIQLHLASISGSTGKSGMTDLSIGTRVEAEWVKNGILTAMDGQGWKTKGNQSVLTPLLYEGELNTSSTMSKLYGVPLNGKINFSSTQGFQLAQSEANFSIYATRADLYSSELKVFVPFLVDYMGVDEEMRYDRKHSMVFNLGNLIDKTETQGRHATENFVIRISHIDGITYTYTFIMTITTTDQYGRPKLNLSNLKNVGIINESKVVRESSIDTKAIKNIEFKQKTP